MPLVRKPPAAPEAAPLDGSAVVAALASADSEARWKAARDAATLPGTVPALVATLQRETDVRVREAMFTSLARIGTTESIEGLLSFLRSQDAQMRTGALDALHTMTGAAQELVSRLLDDPDADVRILSCELARGMPGDAATGLLCRLLEREQHVNVCAAAIEVLVEIGGPEAIHTLERCEQRFLDTPFISFAVRTAISRISGKPTASRA
jgi:HEAT repeat protein